jgi:hypothetical protein
MLPKGTPNYLTQNQSMQNQPGDRPITDETKLRIIKAEAACEKAPFET